MATPRPTTLQEWFIMKELSTDV